MKAMSTCHSVAIQDGDLLASSPDEIALVKFAQDCDYRLASRDEDSMKVNNDSYEIKYMFPFTSVTKRMGIVLYDSDANKYILFVKGADTVIKTTLIQTYPWLQEKVDMLSSEGLRTLVFAYKELTQEEFSSFEAAYHEASCLLKDREQKQIDCENKLFSKLFLLGITGVED